MCCSETDIEIQEIVERINTAMRGMSTEPGCREWENLAYEERALRAGEAGYPFTGHPEEDDGRSY